MAKPKYYIEVDNLANEIIKDLCIIYMFQRQVQSATWNIALCACFISALVYDSAKIWDSKIFNVAFLHEKVLTEYYNYGIQAKSVNTKECWTMDMPSFHWKP